ncbi:MAG: YveK family protein, partial [Solirubrobacterales bacterium]
MSQPETTIAAARPETPFDGLLAIMRRRWLVVAACVVAFPAAALLLASRQETLYKAESKVLLNQTNLANALTDTPDPSLRVDRDRLAKTQIEIAAQPEIARRTLRALHIENITAAELEKNVEVTAEPKTDLLVVGVTDGGPEQAKKLATMYAAQYTVYRAQLDSSAINRTLREVNARLDSGGGSKELRDSLKEKQAELRTMQTLQTKNSIIVRRADSAQKVQPAPRRDAALSLLLGLIVGVSLALLLESRDRRVRDADDLANQWGAPLLGRIPAPARRNGEASVAMIDSPAGSEADAYRRVLTRIEFAAVSRPVRTVVTVSPTNGEGRSEIVANLAVGFARAGRNVLAIDLDFLRPRLTDLF